MPYADLGDLHMWYEETGPSDGPTVVLLHGAGGTVDDPVGGWAALVPAMADRFHLVLVEHRGHGRTANPAGAMTFEQMGDDVAALVERLGAGPVHLGGISDGGVTALDCALRRPDLVRTLTVIGTNHRVDAATLAAVDDLDADAVAAAHPDAAAAFAARHDGGKYPGYWKDLIAQVKANNAVNPSWTAEDLRRVRCPTLLVAGEDDPFANIDQIVVMRREIPRAEWLIVNHAGHAVHFEHPGFVGARIADFVARHS